ncbi:secretory phospholipase A2 receptor-like [Venturia canescens]|uniref:secretory phospholipase A2 receptor-like n=1 Tax=Venturia canescens TaxID=32260 RepID=UPI001C9CD83D|nr:secretory phospholipase A2 receptor-like [Venturia canescens]
MHVSFCIQSIALSNMFNIFIAFVLLGIKIHVVSCKPAGNDLIDKSVSCLPLMPALESNDTKTQNMHMGGDNHFHAAHQTFYLIGHSVCKNSMELNSPEGSCACGEGRSMRPHVVSLKLHLQTVTWNQARKICIEEGGHLAIIRTDEEEKIVLQMMTDKSVDTAWLGLHDVFENGVWISIFDEPVDHIGWSKWSTRFSPNPSSDHCATILRTDGAMTDHDCASRIPFVCKASIT